MQFTGTITKVVVEGSYKVHLQVEAVLPSELIKQLSELVDYSGLEIVLTDRRQKLPERLV